MKYKVKIPIMSFVEVTIECDSEERDDIIEVAIDSFEVYNSISRNADNDVIHSTCVVSPNGCDLQLDSEGIWDDEELIWIDTVND
jgi:hypothetical protein